jgi:hypothetical protein
MSELLFGITIFGRSSNVYNNKIVKNINNRNNALCLVLKNYFIAVKFVKIGKYAELFLNKQSFSNDSVLFLKL